MNNESIIEFSRKQKKLRSIANTVVDTKPSTFLINAFKKRRLRLPSISREDEHNLEPITSRELRIASNLFQYDNDVVPSDTKLNLYNDDCFDKCTLCVVF